METRPPAVAGTFYPSDPQQLRKLIKEFLNRVRLPKIQAEVKALIVPHAGLIYSGRTAAYAYSALKRSFDCVQDSSADEKFDAKGLNSSRLTDFILLGPGHRVGFKGVAQDTHQWWESPLGKLKVKSLKSKVVINDSQSHFQEHSLEVQLPFLQVLAKDTPEVTRSGSSGVEKKKKRFGFTITPLLTGFDVDYEKLVELLATSYPRQKADRQLPATSYLIVSSDLSHYYSQEVAEKIDKKTIQAILDLDTKTLEKEECEACGKAGILTVVSLAKRLGWKPELLHYETSGDVTGDFEQVVGYTSVGFYG